MSLSSPVERLHAAIAGLPPASDMLEPDRLALLKACNKVKNDLQTPFEATASFLFAVRKNHATVLYHNADLISATPSHRGTSSD